MSERVILVTGATGGIGQAVARALAPKTAALFLTGRDPDRLQQVGAELGAVTLAADLCDRGVVQMLVEAVEQTAGRLDVLVNCTGQLCVGKAEILGWEVAEQLIQVNYLAVVSIIHACLPLLRRGQMPVIVNVSSLAGRVAPPRMAAYAASKFAVNGYSYALRQELRPEGIHVGLVLPGPVDTPMIRGQLGGPDYLLPAGIPILSPDRVARAVCRVIERRLPEVMVPGRLSAQARLGSAFPSLVDRVYRREMR